VTREREEGREGEEGKEDRKRDEKGTGRGISPHGHF